MNCESHFTTIKLPGIDPGHSLQTPVIRMSLGPEQTEVCHMYINRFSQIQSESNFTFYQTFYQLKNLVHKSERCHPHSHNLHVYSVLFFFHLPYKYWNYLLSGNDALASFCLVTAENVDIIKDFSIIDNLLQESKG